MFLHVSIILSTGGGGGIPASIAGFQAHTQGEVEGSGWGEVSRPTPNWKVEGSSLGGVQAHTQGGLQAHTWGSPGPYPGGIPACTEADPQQTATAVGSTHPTGMHSWLKLFTLNIPHVSLFRTIYHLQFTIFNFPGRNPPATHPTLV